MKYMIMIIALVFLIGCGKQTNNYTLPTQTLHDLQAGFQGFYTLPNGGYIDIVNDTGSLQDITALRLVVVNADSTTGLIPLTTVSNLPFVNGNLVYTASITYAVGNNIKADNGNAVLSGSLFTMITLSKSSGKLFARIQISNSTGLVFDHTIQSQ